MVKKVYVFGNPLVEDDSLALKVAERLKGNAKGIEFVAVQSLDEAEERNLTILDIAKGIESVQLIEDLDKLETTQPVSGHDFDLAMELKMLKKIGRIGKVKIIAIPAEASLDEAVGSVKALLC